MSPLAVKKYISPLSSIAEPIDAGALLISFFCFLTFVISQPLVVTAVPYPDMLMIAFLGYTTSQDYMNFLYSMTGLLAVGILYVSAYFMRGGIYGLTIMICAFLVGYIALALFHVTSLSMMIAISCLWCVLLMSMRVNDTIWKQAICHGFLMIAACLMPHFAIAMALVNALFSIYPLIRKDISGLYYAGQLLMMGCALILGCAICVIILGFDVQAFGIMASYIDGVILALLMYGLYYLTYYIMHMPRNSPFYYVSLFVPMVAIALLAGRFAGTLT